MKRFLLAALLCLSVATVSGAAFCQDDAAMAAPDTENEYSYGTVVSVNKDAKEIVISEYDWSNDTETNVTFGIDPQIIVENAASWMDIPAGSEVDIEYVLDANGKRIAKTISVYTVEEVNTDVIEEDMGTPASSDESE